jgi:hypothetical protein
VTVRVDAIQFELEERIDLVEVDVFWVLEDDVLEEDFDAVEAFVEAGIVDNLEEEALVEDEDMALDDTSTQNATRQRIKNFESMMIMYIRPCSAMEN